MNKVVKTILIGLSSVVMLVLAAVIILPFVIDVNDYKSEIENVVKEKTGRTLTIEGELKLSVFPWLGVSTGAIKLSNATGFSPEEFAAIRASEVKVKLFPLFSKHVEVSTVVLKGLVLNLAKNKQGISNWDDLIKKSPNSSMEVKKETDNKEKASDAGSALAALAIGGLDIENAQLSWDDQQTGKQLTVKDLNLTVGAVAFNQPITIALSFLFEGSDPKITERFHLSTQLTLDEALQKIQLVPLKIHSKTEGAIIPGGLLNADLLTQVFVDLQQETLAFKGLQVKTNIIDLGANINVSQFKTAPQYAGTVNIAQFSPKKVMNHLKMSVPETSDTSVLQKMLINFDLKGQSDSVAIENLAIILDDTHIKGHTQIKHFSKPAIVFNLTVDNIDIDRYSAPKKEKNKVAPVTPATAVATASTLLPIKTIRALNVSGNLQIDKLKVAQLKMAGMHINIQAKNGLLQTQQTIKQLYKGNYTGAARINVQRKVPVISLNERLKNVQLEPLLTDIKPEAPAKITGTANITAKLLMRGNTVAAVKSTLGGNLSFSVKHGAIRGFNVQKIIDLGKALSSGKKMKANYVNEQTLFSTLQGTATIRNGLMNNPDFLLESSTVKVNGGGTANLVNNALNYQVKAKIKASANSKSIVKGRTVAIHVGGHFTKPTYRVDLMSLITEKEQQKLEKVIDKSLGKGAGKAVNQLLRSFF